MSLQTHLTTASPCDKPWGRQAESISLAAGLGSDGAGEVSSQQAVGVSGALSGISCFQPAPPPKTWRHLANPATFPESAEDTQSLGIMKRSGSNLLNSNFWAFSAHTAFIKLVFSS